ncbi:MAG: sigma-54-dependent Fis family transcriptional regulator [Deltaproteobacteria bacterium]|nr:sigma-54-dependent Fis family transcriptional regulator [Deltaproteobacteria bacterium]MBW1957166.1 sigma-54-dependent Fis family transcriptional regulator [Deltaproteobacteria bacterium]MBW2012404.1 sigma-54-dependent Fis family transcriptional regulator [Deltaproteobacteria bacterium]MBW2087854.1 sigma-54-dependent Fis family transcriptional regulator [Deltaproteobacteria bacterium]MBW2319542.1 sigma-54-dependent Fis family transcriptional regulator [Deltaproteobacteria bacterium]
MDNKITKKSKSSQKRLLIIDDEENMRHMLSSLLDKSGYRVDTASDGAEALEKVDRTLYDFILCDLKMPNMNGMEFFETARDKLWATTVIMMSAYGNIDTAVEAMKKGAYDFISKPFKPDEVLLTLKKAEERESLKRENLWLKERIRKIQENYCFGSMVSKSNAMLDVFKLAEKVSQYNTTVLIYGDSGTGKELIARGIHFAGQRAKKPLVPVNCGSIPENLLESELFGYKKGAFTGADGDRKGLFEEADGGTIFLDEIGELPLSLQVKLLRVLQENEIRAVGDSKTKKIDVRVIAATAKDLEEEVNKGIFREDLFFRLSVLPIKLPPLSRRPEDIPLLCQHFIDRFNISLEKGIKGITPAAMSLLLTHSWPGNVRELENMIERAVVLAEDTILLPEHFPPELGAESDTDHVDDLFEGYSLKAAQKILEKKMIIRSLKATAGNRTKAARMLEISHPSLLSKIKTYNISI